MIVNIFKLFLVYVLFNIAQGIVLPKDKSVKGIVVESNSSVCAIQPLEGELVVAEAYYYCPVGYMVSAELMYKEDATEYDQGIKITNLNVLIGL